MLTGRRAFDAGDISTTLAAVIMKEPDLAAVPPDTPPSIRRLLRRCLEKDPKRRLRDIGDARLELESASESGVVPPVRTCRANGAGPGLPHSSSSRSPPARSSFC